VVIFSGKDASIKK